MGAVSPLHFIRRWRFWTLVVMGMVVGVLGRAHAAPTWTQQLGVQTDIQVQEATQRDFDFEENPLLLPPTSPMHRPGYLTMDPSNVPPYDAMLDDLRLELRPKAEGQLHEWEAPIKCWICKCLVNLIVDDVVELVGDLDNVAPNCLENTLHRVMERTCIIFGPAPFSFVCKRMLWDYADILVQGILRHERPVSICARSNMCYKKLLLPQDPELPFLPEQLPGNRKQGLLMLELEATRKEMEFSTHFNKPPSDSDAETLLQVEALSAEQASKRRHKRPGWHKAYAKERDFEAIELSAFFEKIQFHLMCPACKCLINFVYDWLSLRSAEVDITDEDLLMQEVYEVCKPLEKHPPWNATCDVLTHNMTMRAIAADLIAHYHPKIICIRLLFCSADGVEPGLRSPLKIDMDIDPMEEDIEPPKPPKPDEKSEKGVPAPAPAAAKAEHIDSNHTGTPRNSSSSSEARAFGLPAAWAKSIRAHVVKKQKESPPLVPCGCAPDEAKEACALFKRYKREALCEAREKIHEEQRRQYWAKMKKKLKQQDAQDKKALAENKSKWGTQWEGEWKGDWGAQSGTLKGSVRLAACEDNDNDLPSTQSAQQTAKAVKCDPQWQCKAGGASCR